MVDDNDGHVLQKQSALLFLSDTRARLHQQSTEESASQVNGELQMVRTYNAPSHITANRLDHLCPADSLVQPV